MVIYNHLTLQELKDILIQFEKGLEGYSYKTNVINEKEKVYIIEDSLVLYVGFLTYSEDLFGWKCNCNYIEYPNNYEDEYRLRIEELTYNSIDLKYNFNSFQKRCAKITKKSFLHHYLQYFRCDRFKLKKQIDQHFPDIKLEERNNLWEGVLYYIIVFEITASDGQLGLGIFYTTQKPHGYVNYKCKEWIKYGFDAGNMNMIGQGPRKLWGDYVYHLEQAFYTYIGRGVKQRQFVIENYLKYFFIKKNVKDKDEVHQFAHKICDKMCNGEFQNIERNTYLQPVNKWVTEELVYNLVKKIYKNYKVIYQYRPFFLRSNKGGQMSYDVFITGLNIAIEYQGKQHFEPIEFFGGVKNYNKTIERDKLKVELSKKNNIKLVFINYWENVTPELIKTKINELKIEIKL